MSSRSLNKVLLIGNLTRDPELRYTPQGTAVCSMSIATNRSWTSADGGERQEDTEFHRLTAWSKLAEICGKILTKGRKVFVEGRLQTKEWTTQEGQQRRVTEIVIDNMIVLDAPRGGSQGGDDDGDFATSDDAAQAASAASTTKKPSSRKSKKSSAEDVADSAIPATDSESAEDVSDDIPF